MPEAKIIDGKAHAERLRARIAREVTRLKHDHGLTPGLAAVLVGDDPASQVYVRTKTARIEQAGMTGWQFRLGSEAGTDQVLARVRALNADPAVNGILVQLPLPGRIEAAAVIEAVDPDKDVDGFHPINAGRLAGGRPGLVPCTPRGCLMLLKSTLGALGGQDALVIGRSNIVGKPMAMLLLGENCTVTMAHSRTRDLAGHCREADIVVAAIGKPRMVQGSWLKPGATVIDVGINRVAGADGRGRLVGDVDFDQALHTAGAITPVPGGVGPMTVACLLANTVIAACRQRGIAPPDLFTGD
jgi:methylenetetrahydrofolate dehydrogenase (NADP+)/methenyltetrahydrofolate cyclohydrolase